MTNEKDYKVTLQIQVLATAKNKSKVRKILSCLYKCVGYSSGFDIDGYYGYKPISSKILKIEPVGE